MLIGLVGLKGSGKDTVAKTLKYEFGFKQDSFAAPLKDTVASVFGWDRELVEGSTEESRAWRETVDDYWSYALGREVTPRIILQEVGTEVFRNSFDSKVWTSSFRKRNHETGKDVIVSDVRFLNEAEIVESCGGILVKIKRGDDPTWLKRLLEHRATFQEYIVNDDITGTTYLDDRANMLEVFEAYVEEQESIAKGELGMYYQSLHLPHRSEWEWVVMDDVITYTIENNGTLDELQDTARDLMKLLGRSNSYNLEVGLDGIKPA